MMFLLHTHELRVMLTLFSIIKIHEVIQIQFPYVALNQQALGEKRNMD